MHGTWFAKLDSTTTSYHEADGNSQHESESGRMGMELTVMTMIWQQLVQLIVLAVGPSRWVLCVHWLERVLLHVHVLKHGNDHIGVHVGVCVVGEHAGAHVVGVHVRTDLLVVKRMSHGQLHINCSSSSVIGIVEAVKLSKCLW